MEDRDDRADQLLWYRMQIDCQMEEKWEPRKLHEKKQPACVWYTRGSQYMESSHFDLWPVFLSVSLFSWYQSVQILHFQSTYCSIKHNFFYCVICVCSFVFIIYLLSVLYCYCGPLLSHKVYCIFGCKHLMSLQLLQRVAFPVLGKLLRFVNYQLIHTGISLFLSIFI